MPMGQDDGGWPATEAVLECYIATGAWSAARALFDDLERSRADGTLRLTRDEEATWRQLELEAELQAGVGAEAHGPFAGLRGPDRPAAAGVLADALKVCALRRSLGEAQLGAAVLLETLLLRRGGRHREALERVGGFLQMWAAGRGETELDARLLLAASCAAEQLDARGEAEFLARRALGGARRNGHARQTGEALQALGRLSLAAGRASEAAPLLLSARSELHRVGRLYQALVTLLLLAWARWCEGRVDDAVTLYELGLAEAQSLGQPHIELEARVRLGAILGLTARGAAARAHLLAAVRQARRLADALRLVEGYALLARIAAADASPDRARRALRLAERVMAGIDLEAGARTAFHLHAAQMHLALDEPRETQRHTRLAAELLRAAQRSELTAAAQRPELAAAAQRADGEALLRLGRHAEAITELSRALGPASRAQPLPDRAATAWLLAQALLAQARTPDARAAAIRQRLAAERQLARMHIRPPAVGESQLPLPGRGWRTAQRDELPPGPGPHPARREDSRSSSERGPRQWEPFGIITRSQAFHGELLHVARIAPSMVPILIHGETGAGKELVARAAHRLSGRAGRFVVFNAATRRGELLEAELFGHRRGAFTGAHRDREGLIQQAEGGTLFLDEIADLDPPAQAALLRFLDSGEVRSVGSDCTRCISARIVAASHQSLAQLVARGEFRRDLYFRLAGAEIRVPPLRARREDIQPLVAAFAARHGLDPARLRPIMAGGLGERLQSYPWPGNVRQLAHCVAQLAALAASAAPLLQIARLVERSLPAVPADAGDDGRRPRSRNAGERPPHPSRAELADLVRRHGGNVARMARELHTYRTRVYRLVRSYGLDLRAHRAGCADPDAVEGGDDQAGAGPPGGGPDLPESCAEDGRAT